MIDIRQLAARRRLPGAYSAGTGDLHSVSSSRDVKVTGCQWEWYCAQFAHRKCVLRPHSQNIYDIHFTAISYDHLFGVLCLFRKLLLVVK